MSWVHKLKPGDIILFGRKETPRTIMSVSKQIHTLINGIIYKRYTIGLTIKKCSWTTRPMTWYVSYELERLAKPTNLKEDISTQFRKNILQNLSANSAKDCLLHCWDVKDSPN